MQHPLKWSSSFILTLQIRSTYWYQFVLVNIQSWLYHFSAVFSLGKIQTPWCGLHGLLWSGACLSVNFKFCYSLSPICSPDHTLVSFRLNSYPFTPLYMLLILPLSFSTMGNIHLSRLSVSVIVTSWGELCFVRAPVHLPMHPFVIALILLSSISDYMFFSH